MRIVLAFSLVPLTWFGCAVTPTALAPVTNSVRPAALDAAGISELIPARVNDRRGWGETIFNALVANQLSTDRESACAVIAVIAQESGFQADPVVPALASVVAERIDRYKAKLGPLGQPLFKRLLSGRSPADPRTFEARLATVRTERDVDVLFRDLLAYYEVNHPLMFTGLNWAGKLIDVDTLADLNPITTAGSMQVSVRFAEDWARQHGNITIASGNVRESLYTRWGGAYFGTARLLAYPARYDQTIFRFADYNAGFYASRNAAVQEQLSRLTGTHLARDGDLLSYSKNGRPKDDETESARATTSFAQSYAPQLSPGKIRRDLLVEKSLQFEETETYRSIKKAVEQRLGIPAAYAILPQVAITSPKFKGTRSTTWFAQSVERRYRACLGPENR